MSYGITPIAVSLDQVQTMVGQFDPKKGLFRRIFGAGGLIKSIKQTFGYRFAQDEVSDVDEPTLEQAVRDLLEGNRLHEPYGHKYAYALEVLCSYHGNLLDNSAWTAMQLDWIDEVLLAMRQAGIDEQAIRLCHQLIEREAPISIPAPEDFPGIGYLRNHEISSAALKLASADLAKMNDDARESVDQMREWLQKCHEGNCDLICFCY